MKAKDLVEIANANPELPIFAWVHWEVVQDEGCDWLGEFNHASVREYATVEPYGYHEQITVFKDDTEDYVEYLMENDFKDSGLYLTEEEAVKKAESLDYKKAIFVYIGLPDNI